MLWTSPHDWFPPETSLSEPVVHFFEAFVEASDNCPQTAHRLPTESVKGMRIRWAYDLTEPLHPVRRYRR